ncbi:MAG: bifunctional N(6)-L-threonylcarbamoyladenine synthase/serine/threonine protein kinase [Candidatus Woesearchaeota archaeon]
MITLGIESTAHTFGVAIIKNYSILSNEKHSYVTEEGGMIPGKVAEHHIEVCQEIAEKALEKAKVSLKEVGLISFSNAPGLGHSLKIGASFARSLALRLKVPIIGVNHCIAHLEIGRLLCNAKDPILLYASGANTQVIGYEARKYRIFGETLDMGVGNFIDSFGRELGLGFPAGPAVEKLAKEGNELIDLPYTVKGMDVSFGGMFSLLRRMIKEGKYSKEDLCFSVQETVFAMLVEVSERALAHTRKKELILGGGVACNKRLQEMCSLMCEARGAKSFCPENQYLVDNAAMIAWLGYLEYTKGNVRQKWEETAIKPYERTDEVVVSWR